MPGPVVLIGLRCYNNLFVSENQSDGNNVETDLGRAVTYVYGKVITLYFVK